MRAVGVSLLLIAISMQAGAWQPAQRPVPDPLRALSSQFQTLVDRVKPAVVQIITRGYVAAADERPATVRTRTGSGSGIVVDPEGYIVTNAHVVGSVRKLDVLLPQRTDDRTMTSILQPAG